jgi:ParB family chromosome partitioning protein
VSPTVKKERLGKGLEALLGDHMNPLVVGAEPQRLPVAAIVPNPKQPRRIFPEAELDGLARSIDENGLLQPLLVRPAPRFQNRYELVAGERRLRAVKRLGWDDVPAIIRQVDDNTLLVLALVENLQREALGPIEEAEGYQVLGSQHGMSHEAIAQSVGKSRPTVANMLRLLKLPVSVRKLVEAGDLTVGHARALLAVDDPLQLAELARGAVQKLWSVREVERRVRLLETRKKSTANTVNTDDHFVEALEEEFRVVLGTQVHIRTKKGKAGVIEIPYRNPEDFERVFKIIVGREASDVVS